jgi:uncharacterized protein (DUF1697 family)
MRRLGLLRGLNVGGNNRISMAELTAVFEAAGCTEVSTYIQSGNVVFKASAAVCKRLTSTVPALLVERHGLTSPLVLREAAQVARVLASNPFLARGTAPSTHHVVFLAQTPKPSLVKGLDPKRSTPDEFVVQGSEVFLWLPNGLGRSKLSNVWFDSKLATVSTVRNWNTVLELGRRLQLP